MKISTLLLSASAGAALFYLLLLLLHSFGAVGAWATGPVTIIAVLVGIVGPLCFGVAERSKERKLAPAAK